jgi:hypothetical protein
MTVSSLSTISHIVPAPAKSEKVTPTPPKSSVATPAKSEAATSAASTTPKIAAVKSSSPVSSSTLLTAQSTASTDASTAAAAIPKNINIVVHDEISLNLNSGSTSGLSYSASGLPGWLTISSSGKITGTVMSQENETYDATISVKDSSGDVSQQKVSFNVLAHHYTGWNDAGVSVLAPQAVTKTTTNSLGGTSTVTYPTPNTDY